MSKNELVQETIEVLENPKVAIWYEKNLKGMNQKSTITILEMGINLKELTIKEALHIAFLVGLQWNVKFEGVP